MTIYKEEEFEAFLKTIEKGQVQHWVQIALALGVDKNTISAWKRQPRAKRAIARGISRSLTKMEKAGSGDWRMWEAKLRMLGMSPKPEMSITTKNDSIAQILQAYGIPINENED